MERPSGDIVSVRRVATSGDRRRPFKNAPVKLARPVCKTVPADLRKIPTQCGDIGVVADAVEPFEHERRILDSLNMTDAGRLYYEQSSQALRTIEDANLRLAKARAEPSGTIRISAPAGFGGHFLTSPVFDFLAAYPKTKVELHLTDDTLNLVGMQPSDWPPPGPARMTRLSRIQPKLRLTGAAHDQRAMRPRALIALAVQTQMVL